MTTSFETEGVKKENTGLDIFKGVVALLLVVPSMILGGYTFAMLWLWFATPLGVPAIGIANAIGLSLLVGYATTKSQDLETKKKPEGQKKEILIPVFTRIFFAAGVLLTGFIIHYFFM